jgi:LPXTG-site transpeptidase (sortase) family protein
MEQDVLTIVDSSCSIKSINFMIKALITIVVIIVAGIVIGTSASSFVNKDNNKQVLSTQSQQTPQPTAEPLPGIPVKVSIPSIALETEIESVAMDSKGRMDVPKDANNTAWFNPGYRPGQNGNAVLAGHFDNEDGSPAVFWDIKKLKKGDQIIVTDEDGQEKAFAVTGIEQYPYDAFPIKEVFGESSTSMLNLITCQGEWDEKAKNYSDRMVVYSQLVE